MKIIPSSFLIALLMLSAFTVKAQRGDFRRYYAQAIEAYRAKSYPQFYSLIREANALHPYHQGILYQLGLAAALTGHKKEAIENLEKAILIDNSFKIEGLADFNSLKGTPEFTKLLALQKELGTQVVHSDTAFTLPDRSLHTEGLAYNPDSRTFYAGSIHKRKIVKIKDGIASDFCSAEIEGMTAIFGLAVDGDRKFLWVCSSPVKEMANYDSTARSAVFKFELATGKLADKFVRPKFEPDGVFGDLLITRKGDVLISDSRTNTIFIVNEKTHALEPWFTSGEFWNMQGMALAGSDFIFVSDYIKGLYRIDLTTKKLESVSCSLPVSLKGIDGLCYYKNSLIAIQNGVAPLRVTRLYLNDGHDRIVRSEIIDRDHPAFGEPTLGVVSGDSFYYIANSQWGGYDQQHHILPDSQLKDIVVLHSELK